MVRAGGARVAALGFASLVATLFASRSAFAYHTDEDRQTDFSAFTLRQNQARIGIFQLEYGILDSLLVGTYTAPWVLWVITQDPVLSGYVKWRFLRAGDFAFSLRATGFYANVSDFSIEDVVDEGALKATVIPLTLAGSWILDDRWTTSVEAIWVQAEANGKDAGDSEAFGAGAQDNLQFTWSFEYRLSRVTALNLLGRWAPFVSNVRVQGTTQVDDATSAEVDSTIDASEQVNSWLVQPGVTFSWELVNLQLAVGYGDLFIPGVRLVAVDKAIVPDFALFVRF